MPAHALNHPLDEIKESELSRLARVSDQLLAGRPLLSSGQRPNRLRAGRGYEFLDYQEYVAGADLRNLDWRATARSRHPQVRRFRDEQTSDWLLCLDCSASMSTTNGHKWRLAVQLTATLGYLLLHLGHRVGLLGFSDRCTVLLPPGRGRHHYARLVQRLRGIAPTRQGGASELLQCAARLSSRHHAIIVSDFLAPHAMRPALRRMAAAGCTLQLMHITDEAEFRVAPVDDPVELIDIENRERMPVLLTPTAVDAARTAAWALRNDLSRYCAGAGLRYTACDAATHWKDIVMAHLKGIKPSHA